MQIGGKMENIFEAQLMLIEDEKIRQLVNEQYNTIIISNEAAAFSEDIIKKYARG